ncbi:MAG: acyltransferase [Sinomicrobium sp.]|nr:acyltransferase [Sinomicrobium sp.]
MNAASKITAKLKQFLFVRLRIWKYNRLSTCKNISGKPVKFQPVLVNGHGSVSFGKNVRIGVINSPSFYTGYAYLEARNATASIRLGDNVTINNAFSAIADNSRITIEDDVLIGVNCLIADSDFHETHPGKRSTGNPVSKAVLIRKNVFIGSNVTILKGVCIGENAVIAAGAVVTGDIPDNAIAGGVPAKVLRSVCD